MALKSITKKEILDQLEKNHTVEVPQNLIDNELKLFQIIQITKIMKIVLNL